MDWDYSRHYARRHPDTPEHNANLRSYYQRTLASGLPEAKASAVLDVGCGRGYALEWLRSLGYTNLAGIDPDDDQVAFAVNHGLDVRRVEDSAAFLRQRPGAYDLVLLMDVLEHLPRAAQPDLLTAIHGALKPGGHLLCTVPNASSVLASYWRYVDYTHQSLFTGESLDFLLTQTGFGVDAVLPLEFVARPRLFFWPPTRRTVRWWAQSLGRLPLRLSYLGEVGWRDGWRIPLSPNLLARAVRPRP